jgi:hypothetical protein
MFQTLRRPSRKTALMSDSVTRTCICAFAMSIFFIQPSWVILTVLVPPLAYFWWRRGGGVPLSATQLIASGIFAVSFGFLEAVVVVYLRAASGLLPGYLGTLSDVIRLSRGSYQQSRAVSQLPHSLLTLEVFREAATLVMLLSIAFLACRKFRERTAIFLWAFAIWDITYYFGLWATVRWPQSLQDTDVLFLIPTPWFSPVWFPLLVSILTVLAVLFSRIAPL